MPHLLIAGTTGSGKSVGDQHHDPVAALPADARAVPLIMIDPKMLELSVYDGIPHLLAPVVTDPKQGRRRAEMGVREMEDRYRKMSKIGVRNIDGYNERVARRNGQGRASSARSRPASIRETGEPIFESEEMDLEPMPYIVVIIDEMADLMMVAGKDIEGAVQRLAQMARAAGIHLIMATQRPSVDVITGTIKANFPTRISFQVTSKIDSRTILASRAPSSCWARATCSTWPAAAASRASTAPSSPTRRSRHRPPPEVAGRSRYYLATCGGLP
jgi:S-DNA-T family DNA segregation ATPase FtsK/SpoIIIE